MNKRDDPVIERWREIILKDMEDNDIKPIDPAKTAARKKWFESKDLTYIYELPLFSPGLMSMVYSSLFENAKDASDSDE